MGPRTAITEENVELVTAKMIVYQILNRITGKSYVGQSMNSFRRRYDSMKWWRGACMSRHLKRSIEKHGSENFDVVILEKNVETIERLNELECFHISRLNCVFPNGYNYQHGGQKCRNRAHNPASRDKVALTKNGGKIFRLLNNRTGKEHEFINIRRFSEENDLNANSVALMVTGRLCNGHPTFQHKEWTLPNNPLQRVECYGPNGETDLIIYGVDGGTDGFCRKYGFSPGPNVRGAIAGKVKSANGWTFKIIS